MFPLNGEVNLMKRLRGEGLGKILRKEGSELILEGLTLDRFVSLSLSLLGTFCSIWDSFHLHRLQGFVATLSSFLFSRLIAKRLVITRHVVGLIA